MLKRQMAYAMAGPLPSFLDPLKRGPARRLGKGHMYTHVLFFMHLFIPHTARKKKNKTSHSSRVHNSFIFIFFCGLSVVDCY